MMAVLGSTLQEARAVSFVAAVGSTPPSTAGRLTAAGSCPGPASTSWGSGLSCPQVSKVKQEGGIEGLGRMEGARQPARNRLRHAMEPARKDI